MDTVRMFRNQLIGALTEAKTLTRHVHSFKSRIKDAEHLRNKLRRRMQGLPPGAEFDVTPENVLTTVNDLVGVRILHLYTRQVLEIDPALRALLAEVRYGVVEGPIASTWDDEYRAFFARCGIETRASEDMYTSVHYVVSSSSMTQITAEIQVRTLMEELWGEVSHSINYPEPTDSVAIAEELKVLARVTSAATRLVDTIFLNHDEHQRRSGEAMPAAAPARGRRRTPGTNDSPGML